jgi:hypothetical protein
VIAEINESDALETLGKPLDSWCDEVIPGQVELLPSSSYSPVYAWMFAYEKALKRRIESRLGRPLGPWERRLFGPDGVISEALSNAFLHGHKRAPGLPITVRCTLGQRHLLFVISDRGPGFDVAATLANRSRRSTYFHIAGNGLRCLAETEGLSAWWSDFGRTLRLLIDLGC